MVGGQISALTLPPARLAWTIWGLGALFYLFAFYQRVAPAVMTDQLMAEFAIGGWGGVQENGVRIYAAAEWQGGFILLFGTVACALLLMPFVRKTYCRQTG